MLSLSLPGGYLSLDLVTIILVILAFMKPFSDPLYQMDTDTMILEETTPIRLEVFHYRLKTTTQDAFGSSH